MWIMTNSRKKIVIFRIDSKSKETKHIWMGKNNANM
jgi:hypothetical protein